MTEIVTPPVPPAAPVVTPETPAKPQTLATDLPPEALKARLDQAKETARRELLAELGVTDQAAVKAALDQAKATEESKKSDAQKLAELTARVTLQTEALMGVVERTKAGLTDEQKAAVTAIAGQDTALWLKTYNALAATWAKPAVSTPAAPAAPVAGATPPAVPAVPASTAPTGGAPTPPSTTSPVDHSAVYQGLLQSNPFYAAGYLLQHPTAATKRT